jgi:hypothetical protein
VSVYVPFCGSISAQYGAYSEMAGMGVHYEHQYEEMCVMCRDNKPSLL